MRMKLQCLIVSSLFFALGPPASASVKVGQPAPALEVVTSDGKTFDLGKLQGNIVVIHFLASWCPACRTEMPILGKFYKKNLDHMKMIGLSIDQPTDRESVMKMMHGLDIPWAFLSEAKTNGFGSPRSLPITYLIDSHGIVKKIFTPANDSDDSKLTEDNLNSAIGSEIRSKKP